MQTRFFVDLTLTPPRQIAYTDQIEISSERQRVQLLQTIDFGWMMVVDGEIQIAQTDEHLYHAEVTKLALRLPLTSSVVVLGGGDGCIVRDLKAKRSDLRIWLIDWDPSLVACFDSGLGANLFGTKGFTSQCTIQFADYRLVTPLDSDLLICDLTDASIAINCLVPWLLRARRVSLQLGAASDAGEAVTRLKQHLPAGHIVHVDVPSFGWEQCIYHSGDASN